MTTKTQSRFIPYLLTAFMAGSILLSACAPVVPATQVVPTATSAPAATLAPKATDVPAATAVPTKDASLHLSLNTGSLAKGFVTQTVAAVTDSTNNPIWMVLPEYTLATLQGYPITSHQMKPQIFIYPVKDLGTVNEGAARIAASLQTLLQSPQEIANMPFMPLFNASQMLHVQLQYLDFKSGKGLRYLTQFAQGYLPINNNDLFYTYQGLTNDGKYYVAAVLPVNHPSLPADEKVTGKEPAEFTSDFPAYVANVAKSLNPQAATTFTPDLTQLDAMMSSIEIK